TDTAGETNDLRRRLDSAKAALDAATAKYAPEHPDRIRLEKEVKDLQAQLATQPASVTSAADAPKPIDADNPAYVQIQAQIAATRSELDALETSANKLRARASDYQRNITLS